MHDESAVPMHKRRQRVVVYTYDTPPRKGDFGLTTGNNWAMWVIRVGTLSRYGHACVALSDPWLDGDVENPMGPQEWIRVVEAQPGGAIIRNRRTSSFRWSNIVLTETQRELIATRALATEGIPYDWPSIIGFAARVWGHKLRLIGKKDHPDDKMICSELVVWAYLAAGIDLGQGKPPGDVSPGDLADYLVSH